MSNTIDKNNHHNDFCCVMIHSSTGENMKKIILHTLGYAYIFGGLLALMLAYFDVLVK
jgi:hypothetical protein